MAQPQPTPYAIIIGSTTYIKSYVALNVDGRYMSCTYGYPVYVGYGHNPAEAIMDMCRSLAFTMNAKKLHLSAAPRSK